MVEWFSQGFWVARKNDNGLTLADLRFGELRLDPKDPPDHWRYIFAWDITKDPDSFSPHPRSFEGFGQALGGLWKRLIQGDPDE